MPENNLNPEFKYTISAQKGIKVTLIVAVVTVVVHFACAKLNTMGIQIGSEDVQQVIQMTTDAILSGISILVMNIMKHRTVKS
jgi:hypothetical protein